MVACDKQKDQLIAIALPSNAMHVSGLHCAWLSGGSLLSDALLCD